MGKRSLDVSNAVPVKRKKKAQPDNEVSHLYPPTSEVIVVYSKFSSSLVEVRVVATIRV